MDVDRIMRGLTECSAVSKDETSELELYNVIKQGLPYDVISAVEKQGIIDRSELNEFVPNRTLARRKIEDRLSPEESEKLARLIRIHELAVEVFGNKEKARKWLRTSNRAMSGHEPLQLTHTEFGARIVETVLGRIEHGLFS